MSVQSCASDDALSTAELLRSGVLGSIHEVHVWTDHPLYPAGLTRPLDAPAEPYNLDPARRWSTFPARMNGSARS
jgi:hypothetical protein